MSYDFQRDKQAGTVTVTYRTGTYQAADLIARSMFVVPVRVQSTTVTDGLTVRDYKAIGWL